MLFVTNHGIRDKYTYDLLFNQSFAEEFELTRQFLLDPDQLVVFCNPVRTGQGAGFNLTTIQGHSKVGYEVVFRLTTPVGNDCGK